MGARTIRRTWKKWSKLEKILVVCVCVLCLVIVVLFVTSMTAHGYDSVCNNPQCVRGAAYILDTVDLHADPCKDFYEFACGSFLQNAIHLGQPTTLHVLKDLTNNQLKEIIAETMTDEAALPKSLVLERQFFRSCMNLTEHEEDGDETVLNILKDITGGWPAAKGYTWTERNFSWTRAMVQARRLGIYHQFFLNVETFARDVDGPYYLWIKPPNPQELSSYHWRRDTLDIMIDIAKILGNPSPPPADIWKTMDFAEQLKNITEKHYNRTETDEYASKYSTSLERDEGILNMTIATIPKTYIEMDWLLFLRNVTRVPLSYNDKVVFEAEEYFQDLYYLMLRTPPRIQANYIAWAILSKYMNYMTEKIRVNYGKILKLANSTVVDEKRESICLKASKDLFAYVAEGEYIRRYTTPEKKLYIQDIIQYIKEELKWSLERTSWLEGKDKTNAMNKLKNLTEHIGWVEVVFNIPRYERLFGYDKLTSTEVENIIDITRDVAKARFDRYYEMLLDNVTEMYVMMGSPKLDINAYYVRYTETLILPAPILQGQIFDIHRPQYMNYGALGTIIGHEFTHAFGGDSNEYSYDNYTSWSNETSDKFHSLGECIDQEYDDFRMKSPGSMSNFSGFEENLADYNGLNLAYRAYQKWVQDHGSEKYLPGISFTPNQIFWIMASTYMCFEPKLLEDTDEIKLKDPNHGIPKFRVNGRLKSSYEFARDFNCPRDSAMNPEKKCQVFA